MLGFMTRKMAPSARRHPSPALAPWAARPVPWPRFSLLGLLWLSKRGTQERGRADHALAGGRRLDRILPFSVRTGPEVLFGGLVGAERAIRVWWGSVLP